MTTAYYRVFLDDSEQRVIGLFRRQFDGAGRGVGAEAYHSRDGWVLNDYWLQVARGEPDEHLVEVSEDEAWETMAEFDRSWAARDAD